MYKYSIEDKNAVINVSQEGLLVGDSNSMYYPEYKVSKVELVKVIAKLVGAKEPTDINYTEENIKYFADLSTKYNNILKLESENCQEWTNAYNRYIEYLLGKGIIDNYFVQRLVDDTGSISNATKGDTFILIYKLLKAKNIDFDKVNSRDNIPFYMIELESLGIIDDVKISMQDEEITRIELTNILNKTLSVLKPNLKSEHVILKSKGIVENIEIENDQILISIKGETKDLYKIKNTTILQKNNKLIDYTKLKENDKILFISIDNMLSVINVIEK